MRALAMPLFFVIAVVVAVAMFVTVTSKGLVLAIGFGLFVGMVLYSFASSGAALFCLMLAAYFEGIYKAIAPNLLSMLVKDIFLVILLLRLLLISQRQRNYRWLQQPFTAAAVAFVIYLCALLFAPSTRSLLLALAGFRAWILWMPLFFPVYAYFNNKRTIIRFLTVLLLMQLPVNIYGIIQGNIGYEHTKIIPGFYEMTKWYHVDADVSAPDGEADGDQFESGFKPIMAVRACSIDSLPGTFGSMCVVTILLALGLLSYTSSPAMRLWCLASALAGAGGLLASGSRAPMIALAFGLLALVIISRRRVAAIAGLVVMVLGTVFVLKDLAGGGAIRLQKKLAAGGAIERAMGPMSVGWNNGMDHPFGSGIATGVGAGRTFEGTGLKAAEGSTFIENEFGRAMSELGVVGASVWFAMVFGSLWCSLRATRRLGATAEAGLCAGLLGLMVTVFTQLAVGSVLYAEPGMFYWISAAAILRLAQLKDAGGNEVLAVPPPRRRQKFGRIYLPPGETFRTYRPEGPTQEPQPSPPDIQKPA